MNENRFLTKQKVFSKARIKYLSLIFVFTLMLFISFANIAGAAPVTVVEFNFEDAVKRGSTNFTTTFYTADDGIVGNKDVSQIKLESAIYTEDVSGYAGQALSSKNWHTASESYWYINFSTTGYKELTLSSKQAGSNTGPGDFKVQWSLNYSDWNDMNVADKAYNISVKNDFSDNGSGSLKNVDLPSGIENQPTVYLRWLKKSGSAAIGNSSSLGATGTNKIDDIVVKGNLLTYEISYDANGATTGISPSDQIKSYGISLIVHGNTGALVKTGYTFDGWNTALDGSGTSYNTGAAFTTNGDTTLYAKWLPDTYTVQYDANGATAGTSPSDQIKTHDVNITVQGNSGNLLRTGYTFTGWNTRAEGDGTNYNIGASFSSDADTTLFARWTPDTYIVKYNANGATAGTIPANQVKTHNQDLSIFRNTGNLTKTGYTFVSWNTQADGGGTNYGNGDVFSENANTTLYAKWVEQNVWVPDNYIVEYKANGATTGTTPANQNKTQYVDLSVLGNTGNLTKTGYTFAGWNTKADGSGTHYKVGSTFSINADTMLYAEWISPSDETKDDNPTVILFIDFPGYVIGDKAYRMDVPPYIKDKRTLVPVRFVAEYFGAYVDYDFKTKIITVATINNDQPTNIFITIGSDKIKVVENGVERIVMSDVAASIKNGRTFLPLRAIGEILGAEFDYGPRNSAIEWVSFKMK